MSEREEGSPPDTTISDLQNGIFNMVIALCQLMSAIEPMETAREEVANYLEDLADNLRTERK